MIDTSSWVKFKLSDIGFINHHGIRQTKADRKEGDIPLLTAGKENQGVAAYISNAPSVYTDAITVDMFGNSFFHKGNYAGDDNIYFFINDKISDNAKLFIAAILNTDNSKIYAYKEQFRQPQADALSVSLPATSEGQPDWGYMESYMKAVMEESEKSLESLRKADNTKHLIDVSGWKRFHLYDDCMFGIDMGTKMDKAKMKELHPSVNFVGRANANNGITTCVDKIDDIEPYPSGYMTLSLGGEYLGSCFIQPKSFYTSQNVIVLIPNDNMTDNIKRFIASMIFKESRSKYKAFVDELNRHIKTDFSIPLPITSTGEPDWQYMEDYMRRIMDKSEQIISDLQIGA